MLLPDFLSALFLGVSVTIAAGCILHQRIGKTHRRTLKASDIRKLEKPLPAFLDTVSAYLAAGNSLQQSLSIAVKRDKTPLGKFFGTVLFRVKSGMTLDGSLVLQAEELPGCSLSLALLSMAASYKSGSNVIESLALLATVCRERSQLRKKIMARTAQSRTQGYVLILVPILFMMLLFIVSPNNMIPVIKTTIGRCLIGAALVLQCMGAIVIQSMLKQEIL